MVVSCYNYNCTIIATLIIICYNYNCTIIVNINIRTIIVQLLQLWLLFVTTLVISYYNYNCTIIATLVVTYSCHCYNYNYTIIININIRTIIVQLLKLWLSVVTTIIVQFYNFGWPLREHISTSDLIWYYFLPW